MTPGARLNAVLDLLVQVLAGPREAAPAPDVLLETYFRARRYAGSGDRRAVSDRFYGLLRRQSRLGWWLDRCSIDKNDPLVHARARVLADLVLWDHEHPAALADLFSGQGHAPEPLTATEAALAQTLHGQPLTHPQMPPPTALEYPEWADPYLRRVWTGRLDTEMQAMNRPAPVDLRVNGRRATRAEVQGMLAAEGIASRPGARAPLALRLDRPRALTGTGAFRQGLMEVQDEGSQLVSLLVGAAPGMTVVDFCAGAGGKTLALADAMGLSDDDDENAGRLIACDIDRHRLDRMAPRLKRAGLSAAVERRPLMTEDDPWIAHHPGLADRVLLDVPCSGLGTWRRDPTARWRLSADDVAVQMARQDAILDHAAPLVKAGGRLVYVTCSVLAEENEDRLAAFLDRRPDFAVVPVADAWPLDGPVPCDDEGLFLRLSPATTDTDGFFAAVLERVD
ncbi:MAG: RsmB/NOP family class I SAM-dependent RNA methyltransferase [Rhodobacterales bacterium]|nr:RsmB/NOP family class I SAM-dependent RNA methyltransferase [Rhodobacterales bacterium]